ncbi:MAG: tRNA pseudouridine(38-40) synthase TruA [Phycisphaerae bacterium]|nr:tRNA pseudouridine(38-40) synthase TruA [Phycisphaerae bacterium]
MDAQRLRRNIKLVVAYDGRRYHGWQRQEPRLATVQQSVEDAAGRVVGHPVTIYGAGRTDAGVHAAGQVANFYTSNRTIPLEGLRRAINAKLPGDIVIRSAADAANGFHASRSAVGKTYRYRIRVAPLRDVMAAGQVYHYFRTLDVPAMRDAAGRLVGTHDFVGFAASAEERRTSVRTIRRCEIGQTDEEVHITVEGDGFLYNMVRIIAGTLVEVGRGRWTPERIDRILATCNRRDAGPTAPPDGLYLICVHYPPNAPAAAASVSKPADANTPACGQDR